MQMPLIDGLPLNSMIGLMYPWLLSESQRSSTRTMDS